MDKKFKPMDFFKIPDGTLISPFLNSKDSMSDLPFELIDGFSMAMGKIEANSSSLIHVHPHVDQVTFVIKGSIILRMKEQNKPDIYEVKLEANQAGFCRKGEFFQLVNSYDVDAEVLYIVSPAYLFEFVNNKVVYDDAIILKKDWDELSKEGFLPSELQNPNHSLKARNESFQRLLENKKK